jgi:hypothetical protein
MLKKTGQGYAQDTVIMSNTAVSSPLNVTVYNPLYSL